MRVGNQRRDDPRRPGSGRYPLGMRSNSLGPPSRSVKPLLQEQEQAAITAAATANKSTATTRSSSLERSHILRSTTTNNNNDNNNNENGSLNRTKPSARTKSGIQKPTTSRLSRRRLPAQENRARASKTSSTTITTTKNSAAATATPNNSCKGTDHVVPSSFRRQIMETLSPQPATRSKVTISMDTSMTPTSLLRKEIEAVSSAGSGSGHNDNTSIDLDDSLLLSPAPVVTKRRPNNNNNNNKQRQEVLVKMKTKDKVAPLVQANAVTNRPLLFRKKTEVACTTNEPHSTSAANAASIPMADTARTTLPRKIESTAVQATTTLLAAGSCPPPAAAAAPQRQEPEVSSKKKVYRKLTITIPTESENSQRPPSQSSSCGTSSFNKSNSKEQVPLSAMHPEQPSPVQTPRGICMDLSNMFGGAATVAAKPKRPLLTKLPPRKPAAPPSLPAPTQQQNDDCWANRQCEMFKNWLNYTLQPAEDSSSGGEEQQQTTGDNVPKQVRSRHSTLLFYRHMASARSRAKQFYASTEIQTICKIVQAEVSGGRIAIRKDRDLYADRTMREQILDLLLSYTTPWLHIGLEIVMGEQIEIDPYRTHTSPINNNNKKASKSRQQIRTHQQKHSSKADPTRLALRKFIIHHVLSDDATLNKYTHGRCILPSGKFEAQYQAEMRQLVLYRLLVLFLFLDRAKQTDILDNYAPRLFRIDSKVKSSKDVLYSFSRDFLSCMGDFIKHLARVKLRVSYEQKPIDELNFTVSNLGQDLRDGVKLVRMTEILTNVPRKSLLSKLRLPARDRTRKIYNVELALKKLRSFGVPIPHDILGHHVIDAHREVVLKLLWSIVAHCCLGNLINAEQVQTEIHRIERLQQQRQSTKESDSEISLFDTDNNNNNNNNDLQQLLLRWCNAVCSTFGFAVGNLTIDFADGKAACFLIHYYHPNLLRRSEIRRTTRDLPAMSTVSQDKLEQLRANERFNTALANRMSVEVGGMPKMVPIMDTSSPPDEKQMLLCLSFLFSRLLESKLEVRSCVLIQNRYRRYRRKVVKERNQAAALYILKTWREFRSSYYKNQRIKYGGAVKAIEHFLLERKSNLSRQKDRRLRREAVRMKASIRIQVHVRKLLAVRLLDQLRSKTRVVIICQSLWRRYQARNQYLQLMESRHQFYMQSIQNDAVIRIQAFIRGSFLRRHLTTLNNAANLLQRFFRKYFCQMQYYVDRLDVIAVQNVARRFLAIRELGRRKHAVTVITRSAAHYMEKKTMLKAACRIQTFIRGHRERIYFTSLRNSSKRIQCAWRVYSARSNFNNHIQSVEKVQSCIRMFLARLTTYRLRRATAIQALWRGCIVRSHNRKMYFAAQKVQTLFKGYRCRCFYIKITKGIILIQAGFRRSTQQKMYRMYQQSALVVQKHWRGCLARDTVSQMTKAAVSIQSVWRMALAGSTQYRETNAAIKVQRYWRGFSSSSKYTSTVKVAIVIQSAIRGWLTKFEIKRRHSAILRLQRAIRQTLARRTLIMLQDENDLARQHSSLMIQKMYRGHVIRREVCSLHISALCFQTAYRGYRARANYIDTRHHTIIVQSFVRCRLGRREFTHRIQSLVLLQCCFRLHLAKELLSKLRTWQKLHNASTTIQRAFRMYRAKTHASREEAAMKIQSIWRGYAAHVEYLLTLLAAMTIQRAVEGFLSKREEEHEQHRAATLLQSSIRMDITRRAFLLQKNSAIMIQRTVRDFIVRFKQEQVRSAACNIQKIWRGYKVYINYAACILDVIKIQKLARAIILRQKIERLRAYYVSHMRHAYEQRCDQAARYVQRAVRNFLRKLLFKKLRKGVVHFQAAARGRHVRSRRSKKVAIQAQKIEKENAVSAEHPDRQLGNLTLSLLKHVHKHKVIQIAKLRRAMEKLEKCTRLSDRCCYYFSDANAPAALFQLLIGCNRSEPHLELVTLILKTMCNVSRYTVTCMATATGVEAFVRLIQTFRSKDEIFCRSAGLLELVLLNNSELPPLRGKKENLKLLNSILKLQKLSKRNKGTTKFMDDGTVALHNVVNQYSR